MYIEGPQSSITLVSFLPLSFRRNNLNLCDSNQQESLGEIRTELHFSQWPVQKLFPNIQPSPPYVTPKAPLLASLNRGAEEEVWFSPLLPRREGGCSAFRDREGLYDN